MGETKMQHQLTRYNCLFKNIDHVYRQFSRAFNLPEAALWILYFLRDETVTTQKDICDKMYQSKQSIHSALKKLERDGYLILEGTRDHRGRKPIRLTEKGNQLAHDTADQIIAAEEASFERLSLEGTETLLSLYERFASFLEAEMTGILNGLAMGTPTQPAQSTVYSKRGRTK